MRVADVMSSKVVTVSPDTPYRQIWGKVFTKHINAIPVVDSKRKLLGLITRQDLLTPLYPNYQDVMENLETISDFEIMEDRIEDMSTLKAKNIMSKKVIFTREKTLIMRALSRMIVRRVNQLPVLNDEDALVGMVTKGDIFYSLFRAHLSEKKKTKIRRPARKK